MTAGSLLRYIPLPYPRTWTLSRYFGMRFLTTAILVFIGILLLVALTDYIEMMRSVATPPTADTSDQVRPCRVVRGAPRYAKATIMKASG